MDNPAEPSTPDPKRFYWLKRFAIAALVGVVLLVGLRLIWGQRIQSRLDQTIADIQAKGEPILFEDLKSEPIPDQENGAWYLRQALQNWPFVPGTLAQRITDTDWYIEGEEAGHTDPITDNAAYLKSCEQVLEMLRQAEELERAVWHTTLTRPLMFILLPQLGDSRELARLVEDLGKRAIELGETELIFKSVLLHHTIARHVQRDSMGLIDSIVAISIMAMTRDYIEHALPMIDPADLRSGRARELAKQAIARFTDGMLNEGMIEAFVGERAVQFDLYECLIDGTASASDLLSGYDDPIALMIDTPGLDYLIRPVLKSEQDEIIQVMNTMIAELRKGATPSKLSQIEDAFEDRAIKNPLLYPIQAATFGYYGSSTSTLRRCEATLHCAAIAIAIKLYQADHDGKRPDTLDALVPEYLPAIPVDPYSQTGEPIRYNPLGITAQLSDPFNNLNKEQRDRLTQQSIRPYPLLYSIGQDGIDQQGGPLYLHPQGNLDDSERYGEQGDIWFLLDAWPEAIFDDSDLYGDDDAYEYDFDSPF